MSTLISFYSNLYRTDFIFDTKVEDYETILISILSEILEINDNIEDKEENKEDDKEENKEKEDDKEKEENKEENKDKLSKKDIELFSKLSAIDKKILNIRIFDKTNLIKFSYIYKNNQIDFDMNNYGKLIHDSVISESLLDFISNIPVLPIINDIETERNIIETKRNIIEIDLEFQIINYNFKLTKESEDFIEKFKETIPSFHISYCRLL